MPSRLIGHRLRVRLHDDRLECFLGSTPVLTLSRGRRPRGVLHGRLGYMADYRHVIHALRRKPQALLNLVYRDQLFPRAAFRRTWEALIAAGPPRIACRTMVGLLALAHEQACETELAAELETILEVGGMPDLADLRARVSRQPSELPSIVVALPTLAMYDALLGAEIVAVAACARWKSTPPGCRCCCTICGCPPSAGSGPRSPRAPTRRAGQRCGSFLRLPEMEIAERAKRRTDRHLAEIRLPPGKTLDGFDFSAVPMISKAHLMALAAGDTWLEKGSNLLLFGPPKAET